MTSNIRVFAVSTHAHCILSLFLLYCVTHMVKLIYPLAFSAAIKSAEGLDLV